MEIKTILIICSSILFLLAVLSVGLWHKKLKHKNICSSLRWLFVSCILLAGFSYARSLYSGFIHRDLPAEEAENSMELLTPLLTASDVLIQTAVMSLLLVISCVGVYLYFRNRIKAQ